MFKFIQNLIERYRAEKQFDDVMTILDRTVKLSKQIKPHLQLNDGAIRTTERMIEFLPKFDLGRRMGHTTAIDMYAQVNSNVVVIVKSYQQKRLYNELSYADDSYVMSISELDIWTIGNRSDYTLLIECANMGDGDIEKVLKLIKDRPDLFDAIVLVQPK